MELRPIDSYFLQHNDHINVCLQFLRQHILNLDENISESWKYEMPFFVYKKQMCCYLWVHKKLNQPYIGIVEGALVNNPALIQEGRARMKILLINPYEDLPMETINDILQQMLAIYKK
ncbi:DUF1801 domain-containing protein [Dysgonomonas macrotermitis]|uniref:YdhG-like domain-containing protein n=1 Tax=Dysgonomonas macrotermitis TaxID=1346286 RepID=A0A1M5EIA6_9BACT|nr:DUF1801 domain-containing protein [Dysgonomonas macrotermitis]SHF78854.1 protein of unknown function (DU1801) [Dysgonomonas macrotermitis]